MRLAGWRLAFYRLPYMREVVWSNAVERAGTFALLELSADNGARGIAEGTLKDTWSGVSPRSLAAALEDVVLPQVREVDLGDAPALGAALARVPENRLAKAMVDGACWTLRAAAAGEPLWRMWGGNPSVELSWTVTRGRPAAMAADAAKACAQHGFRALKVKGGQGVETDARALFEIRAAVGEEVELFVDANSAYRRDEALAYVRRVAEAGARVAEDPCPLRPDAEFEALQQGCGIPVLVDGSCTALREAEQYLGRGARALSLKPGRVGLSESRAIAAAAAARRARTTIGIYAESALGTLVHLQLGAALPQRERLPAEQSFFLELRAQVAKHVPEVRAGTIELPAQPDLSQLVDWEAVKRYAL